MTQLAYDSLTDAEGVSLQNHTGENGLTWTKHANSAPSIPFTNANRLRAGGTGFAYCSIILASADYKVTGKIYAASTATTTMGVIGRVATDATTFYAALYDRAIAGWQLAKFVSGTQTNLGSYSQAMAAGAGADVTLWMEGSTIKLLVNGVERVSTTDASITAAGRAGVRCSGSGSNTAGMQLDSFTLEDFLTSGAKIPMQLFNQPRSGFF